MGLVSYFKKYFKAYIIVGAIIIYLFTLSIILIKHSKDDVDSVLFNGEAYLAGVEKSSEGLEFVISDSTREYSEIVSLDDIYSFNISFDYVYPENTRDTFLYIDLFNFEQGYDDDSQQFEVIMRSGSSSVNNTIILNDNHPNEAYIRFVSLEKDVAFGLTNIKVCVVTNEFIQVINILWIVDLGFIVILSVVICISLAISRRAIE